MKRRHQRPSPKYCGRHRRGAVFAYVMAYMTLSMLLLGLTGTTLHLLFRSSETDLKLFRDLARIRNVERRLREDLSQASGIDFADEALGISAGPMTVSWRLDGNKAVREVLRNAERDALMSVTFRRGTQLRFVAQSASLFVLRITPPAPNSTADAKKRPARINTPLRAVEILLPRPVADDPTNQ